MENQRTFGRLIFDRQFDHVVRLIDTTARRQRLSQDERDDLYSNVMMRVIDDDYAILRAFRHRSSWRTYLAVIIQRVLLDHRTKEWGRWRPCVRAKRLGPSAIWLDQKINRDGFGPDEAVAALSSRDPNTDVSEIQQLADQIPRRGKRKLVRQEACLEQLSDGVRADNRVQTEALHRTWGHLRFGLKSAFRELPPADLELLRLRFGHGWTVRRIAKGLNVAPRPLYSRFDRITGLLRRILERRGLVWEEVRDVLGTSDLDLDIGLHAPTNGQALAGREG